MEEYTLYLDESTIKNNTFLIGGLIVNNKRISELETGLLKMKNCIWDDEYISENSPILHCVDLTRIKKYRESDKFSEVLSEYPNYAHFDSKTPDEIKSIYDAVYIECCMAYKKAKCTTIGCSIDINELKYIYGNKVVYNSNLFFEVAIQEIISNYAHFLEKHNGVGNIIYESRNDKNALTEKSEDFKMFLNFCKIKTCNKGLSFIDEKTIAKTIRYFYFYEKSENVAGLQFADFVAYNLIRIPDQQNEKYRTEFMGKIQSRLYNGTHNVTEKDLRNYFGLKKVPFSYQSLVELQKERNQIRRSYDKLKNEKNKIKQEKDRLIEEKEKLIEELNSLKKPAPFPENST